MADCTTLVIDCLGAGLEWALNSGGEALAAGGVVAFAKAIGEATESVLASLNSVWLNVDAGADAGSAMTNIMEANNWLVGYVAVASLLVACIRMALDRRGQSMKAAFMGMWKVLLVGAVAVPVVQALTAASDTYARDVYRAAKLDETANTILGVLVLDQPGLMLIFGLLVMLSTIVQICLMYIRIGVMIMLIGTLPLAAVSSMTGWGEGWWKKHVGWLAAWLLYKPAAALIIYSATSMTQNTDDLGQVIAGMAMLAMAVFALPALLKLIVPATAALGGTSGGTVALNVANNVASGAVSIAGGGGGGGGGGGKSASSGPQGSPSAGAGSPAGGAGAAGGSGARSAGAAGGTAAAGAATGGAAVGLQVAAVAAQTQLAAATEVMNSLDDNDGMKGHNQ
ncbi:hypothetical protein [Streptomyces sp. NBC_01314]|uniref:hypothetical protein n=1 Tax=Streptomyces sp. NBC_01314 TaxID=2903821 RepID=UPI003086636A|nr:hypothetical protein OG622_20220 [Streptomyces sp. NBC_01314]